MLPVIYFPPEKKYFKKLKDKQLKDKFKDAIIEIQNDPSVGEQKKGDLAGVYGYDVYYNKTNYEIAYKVIKQDGEYVIIIMAGTRENFWGTVKDYIN